MRQGTVWTWCQSFDAFSGAQQVDFSEACCGRDDAMMRSFETITHICMILKWLRSVTSQNDFVSKWAAFSRALDLAWSNGYYVSCNRPLFRHHTSSTMMRAHSRSQCNVSFNPEIQILLGEDDRVHMYSAQMSNGALQSWIDKPWGESRLPHYSGPLSDICLSIPLGSESNDHFSNLHHVCGRGSPNLSDDALISHSMTLTPDSHFRSGVGADEHVRCFSVAVAASVCRVCYIMRFQI